MTLTIDDTSKSFFYDLSRPSIYLIPRRSEAREDKAVDGALDDVRFEAGRIP